MTAICIFFVTAGPPCLAEYEPSPSGQPVWLGAGPPPEAGPDLTDGDLDRLPNWHEAHLGTDPDDPDSDDDLIMDGDEVWITQTHPLLKSTAGNGISDYATFLASVGYQGDTNLNGVPDSKEPAIHNSHSPERAHWGLYPTRDQLASIDTDNDGISDWDELWAGGYRGFSQVVNGVRVRYPGFTALNPTHPDTDGDGIPDGEELAAGTHLLPPAEDEDRDGVPKAFDPDDNNPDFDGDGLPDGFEWIYIKRNAMSLTDTDGDTVEDFDDVIHGASPHGANVDEDYVGDALEIYSFGTHPSIEDTDQDGVEDWSETLGPLVSPYFFLTNPNSKDTDGDGLTDAEEYNARWHFPNATAAGKSFDPTLADTNGDGFDDWQEADMAGDLVDTDDGGVPDFIERWYYMDATNAADDTGDIDSDGINNIAEYLAGTPLDGGWWRFYDWDYDGLSNVYEIYQTTRTDTPLAATHPHDPLVYADSEADPDNDGLINLYEMTWRTDPYNPDSDSDGLPDGWEVQNPTLGHDPRLTDTDGDGLDDGAGDFDDDGLSNLDEFHLGLDPLQFDSDGDGMDDGWETQHHLNPLADDADADADNDGASNWIEMVYYSDPNNPDTDGDLWTDGEEINYPSDVRLPTDPQDSPEDPVYLWIQPKYVTNTWAPSNEWNPPPNSRLSWYDNGDTGTELYDGDSPRWAQKFGQLELQTAPPDTVEELWTTWWAGNFLEPPPDQRVANALARCSAVQPSPNEVGVAHCSAVWVSNEPLRTPRVMSAGYPFLRTTDLQTGQETWSVSHANPMIATIPAGHRYSAVYQLTGAAPDGSGPLMPELGLRKDLYLLPMELAPEVLAVNTNFDEGDVDDESHYAKPDCENGTLKAVRDHLDGNWEEGDIVTEDLHKGFFGLRPGTLPYSETAGAVVKIKKLDKNDPETNRKQSGHVRLYAVWGSQGSESEMKIELYDKDSLVANDIGPQLYHQNPNTPLTFYLEGVEPGKITLEFSYQKGSTSFKHEQEFLVATNQTKDKWLKEIRYQLLLQTDGAVDLHHYLPNNGGWRPRQDPASGLRSFIWHKDRVRAIYDYYGQLFEQWPEKLDWMGAARMVGGAVYGGLCDLQASTPSFSVMDELLGGQILIYRDLAWQHRAYVASGIWALEWVDEHDSASVNGIGGQGACEIEVWRSFDGAISSNSWSGVKEASRQLVRREQQEVIAPMWADIMSTASGFATIASNEAKNPVDPSSPTFHQVVPGGNVANYPDRSRFSFGWANSPKGVFPVWWGEAGSSGNPAAFYGASTRLSLVRIPLRTRAALFAQFGTIY